MRKDRSLPILVLLIAASLALTAMDRRESRGADAARSGIGNLASAFSWRGSAALMGLRRKTEVWLAVLREKEGKAGLEKKIETLELEIVRLKEVENRYGRLSALSDFEKDINPRDGYRQVAAEVTGADMSKWHKTIIINKGAEDGVRAGAPVVASGAEGRASPAGGKAAGGIIGRIFRADANSSIVLLLNDHDSGIGGMVQRNRIHGIVKGTPTGRCVIEDISNTADVRAGDVVISSGIGGVFPKGLVIGKVASAEKRRTDFFQKIELVPFVDISKTEEVVVLNKRDE